MNALLLAGMFALLFIPALVVAFAILHCRNRLVVSSTVDRAEKNGHHLATALMALLCLGLAVAGFLAPVMNHPILWLTVAFTGLILLPIRMVTTELGIRRRKQSHR